MATVTVATALDRITRLIPVTTAAASRLTGDYAAMCTPAERLPEQFREAQRERTAYYMSHTWEEGNRCKPDHAPRYIVTSYGVPIAWVTLDGRTHYIDATDPTTLPRAARGPARVRTLRAHLDAIRATWPERFEMNTEGDPVRV